MAYTEQEVVPAGQFEWQGCITSHLEGVHLLACQPARPAAALPCYGTGPGKAMRGRVLPDESCLWLAPSLAECCWPAARC